MFEVDLNLIHFYSDFLLINGDLVKLLVSYFNLLLVLGHLLSEIQFLLLQFERALGKLLAKFIHVDRLYRKVTRESGVLVYPRTRCTWPVRVVYTHVVKVGFDS